MPIRVTDLYLPLDHDEGELSAAAAGALGLGEDDLAGVEVLRRAVDARRKPNIRFVYTLLVTLADPGREAEAAERADEGTARIEPTEPTGSPEAP
ncbi:MAG: NAD(P)/FAD-dependent oxidoreductase, partial [Planctomycetota bacterium]